MVRPAESKREQEIRLKDHLEEEALMCRIAAGDHLAFELLYEKYLPRLRGYLARHDLSHPVVEEVCDDVMLVVWRKAARFDTTYRLSTWIFGIARLQALKARAQATAPPLEVEPSPVFPTGLDDPEIGALRRERDLTVMQAMAALPPALSLTIMLAYYRQYSYHQIATQMDCSVHTVKARLSQARRCLASALLTMT